MEKLTGTFEAWVEETGEPGEKRKRVVLAFKQSEPLSPGMIVAPATTTVSKSGGEVFEDLSWPRCRPGRGRHEHATMRKALLQVEGRIGAIHDRVRAVNLECHDLLSPGPVGKEKT